MGSCASFFKFRIEFTKSTISCAMVKTKYVNPLIGFNSMHSTRKMLKKHMPLSRSFIIRLAG
jgi:hypothetical protein